MKKALFSILLILLATPAAAQEADQEKKAEAKAKVEKAAESASEEVKAEKAAKAEAAEGAAEKDPALDKKIKDAISEGGDVPEPPPALKRRHKPTALTDCRDGVVLDDGTAETGYGFIPDAKSGIVVQRFDSSQFSSREIERVCVCWLRSREADALDFEVVFFEDQGGRPAATPYATAAGRAEDLPTKENAGRFYPVEVKDVKIPEGPSFIGVRWDPSDPTFVFVCSNKSEESEVIPGFQRDDLAPKWNDVINTRDRIFWGHRSILLRPKAKPAPPKEGEAAEAAEAATD